MAAVRWGILATGWIADQLAQAINDQPDATCLAVGSRSQSAADKFGDKWHIPRRYPTYEALVADPDLDVIYIATPHNLHYENMKLCLKAGKPVLCEKPLTINAAQARECIELAREQELFLMEAMWMKCIPAIQQMQRWLEDGRIGKVRLVQAHFSFPIAFDPKGRLDDPALAGGALLDMGVYPATLAHLILGKPDRILSAAHLAETGVDDLNSAIWTYDSGAHAVINSSQRLVRPSEAFISGSQGYIKVHHMFLRSQTLTLQEGWDAEPEVVQIPFESNGYIHQVREVQACLRAGKLESDIVPHSDTLEIMTLMDEMRAQWGLTYPQEAGGV